MIRVGLDTNVLAYAAGVEVVPDDAEKVDRAIQVIDALADRAGLIIPVQALCELYAVLRKRSRKPAEASEIVRHFHQLAKSHPSSEAAMLAALELATDHSMQMWDALILAAAAEANCTLLLSEDMQDGFAAAGVTVVNPFAARPHARLRALLNA